MAGILDELAPQDEVDESELGIDGEPAEAQSFIFEMNNEGLPIMNISLHK